MVDKGQNTSKAFNFLPLHLWKKQMSLKIHMKQDFSINKLISAVAITHKFGIPLTLSRNHPKTKNEPARQNYKLPNSNFDETRNSTFLKQW